MATKLWGPLGWMTLHSVSVIYPDTPTFEEKQIAREFLKEFAACITCNICKDHFTVFLNRYMMTYPSYLDSKHDFFMFVVRAHNDVNRRLDKPVISTVSECLQILRNNTQNTTPAQFRQKYMNYLIRNWSYDITADGYIAKQSANKINKIMNEYFNPRDRDFNIELPEDSTIVFQSSFSSTIPTNTVFAKRPEFFGGFKNGRIQLFR
jgi:hypothetical protein